MTRVRGYLFFAILLSIAGTFFYLRHNTVSVLYLQHDNEYPSVWKMMTEQPPIFAASPPENQENISENEATSSITVPSDFSNDNRIWWISPRINPALHHNSTDWSKEVGIPSWTDGFCKEFLVNTFDRSSSICTDNNNIVCYGSHYNNKMGTCTLTNTAVMPETIKEAFASWQSPGKKWSSVAWLVNANCSKKDFNGLNSYMEKSDPFQSLVTTIAASTTLQKAQSECKVWVKGTSFFYTGVEDHIYFKVLSWYNLHRTLLTHSNISTFNIIRFPGSRSKFWFLDFEETLFPQSVGIDQFQEEIVCFEKVILVPWTFSATPFRCRIDSMWLRNHCMKCKGNGLETDLISFRRRVLSACSLFDTNSVNNKKRQFVIIHRKQYIRRLGDVHGKFQRIWTNSIELIDQLKISFPNDSVIGMYGEDMEICQQIQLVHSTNVLIGIHGAGMVHLWWLQENAISFEIVPPSQRTNAAFSLLSTFLGKKHYQFRKVKERGSKVTVEIEQLILDIKTKLT